MDLVRHLLFENPTTLWILLGLVAVVALLIWLRTRSEKSLWVAAGCVLLSVALASWRGPSRPTTRRSSGR